MYIKLNGIESVKEFIKITEKYEEDILVTNYKYIVDGKSILGVLSLNLLEKLYVTIIASDKEIKQDFYNKLTKWEVKE